MKSLAIIPARGGSKRIPRKNIRAFLGKPIITYSIETALNSGCFDEVMVSTDDEEIADIAKQYGAKVPFLRSAQNATDEASTEAVLIEVLEFYAKNGCAAEVVCCIYPTAPLISQKDIQDAFHMLTHNENIDVVFPVVQFSYPIQRALKLCDHKISMFQPEYESFRSQDLEPAFHDAGQFYWCKVDRLLKTNKLFSDRAFALVLPEYRAQDIDNESDWILAEMKYKLFSS